MALHGWGCAGFTWKRGPCPADLPTAMQAAEPGRTLPKTPGITLRTKTGTDRPEQSGQASRVRGSRKQERQVWEKDGASSDLPPNSVRRSLDWVLLPPDRLDVSPCSGH